MTTPDLQYPPHRSPKPVGLFFCGALFPQAGRTSVRSDHAFMAQLLDLLGGVSKLGKNGVGILAQRGNCLHAWLGAVEKNRRSERLQRPCRRGDGLLPSPGPMLRMSQKFLRRIHARM